MKHKKISSSIGRGKVSQEVINLESSINNLNAFFNYWHKKVSDAYTSWRARQGNADTISQRCNQTLVAPTWLCQAVVLAGFKYAVPKFGGNMNYRFTEEELS